MLTRIVVGIILTAAAVFVITYVIVYLVTVYEKFKKQRFENKIEFNDLTNESAFQEIIGKLTEIKNDMNVIKYCMIFFVVTAIFAIIATVIAYLIHLLS